MTGPADASSLRIVHVLRAPLGGLFRHVLDLAREQISRGHQVGLITDSLTGGERAEKILQELSASLELGLLRLPMQRNPSPSDLGNLLKIARRTAELKPHVVHGHGSKGGLYARLPGLISGSTGPIRAYTPHGGSFNYKPGSLLHKIYMRAESLLDRGADLYLFESAYIQSCFANYVGPTDKLERVVLNGISDAEFDPVEPDNDAADFFYVGELRSAKGIDTLIDALAIVHERTGRRQKAVLVGSGPDQQMLTERASARGLADDIRFPGAMPAREAFRKGRILLVPSRAESLPYVVLEAAGAAVPMVSTNVGGIPEIFGPYAASLIDCDDPELLAEAMLAKQRQSDDERRRGAMQLRDFVQSRFHVSAMADAVLSGYREGLSHKAGRSPERCAPLPASS